MFKIRTCNEDTEKRSAEEMIGESIIYCFTINFTFVSINLSDKAKGNRTFDNKKMSDIYIQQIYDMHKTFILCMVHDIHNLIVVVCIFSY